MAEEQHNAQSANGVPQYDLVFVQRLLEEQERSGKMLIRRDLELTRANERLRELDKLKTDFVSTATHQMRTPLAGIKWGLGMLLNGDFGEMTEDQQLYIRKAYVSTERMIELLRDMLFAEQVGSGTFPAIQTETDIMAVCQSLLREMHPLAYNQQVKMEFVHDKDMYPTVKASPEYVEAILQNLLENAIKYSHPKGTVTLNIKEEKPNLVITVSDMGIGIPQEQQNHIFERFYRAENAKKEITDGSGLGLYIAKQLVEKAKGSIRFDSIEGKGTTFTITLPLMYTK